MLKSFRSYGSGVESDDGGMEKVLSSQGVINPRRFRTLQKRGSQSTGKDAESDVTASIPLTMHVTESEQAEPPDYEDEVQRMEDEIKEDECPELLRFPEDDIEVKVIPRQIRTEKTTVPAGAADQAQSLFVTNCVKRYSSDWHTVRHNYSKFSGDYTKLQRPGAASGLPDHTYEVDVEAEANNLDEQGEELRGEESAGGAGGKKESSVIKEGWLTKTPFFDSRGFAAMTMRQFKRRWYAIRQNPDKSYVIVQHKDDSSSAAKHMLSLDAVTAVLEGVMEKENGFRVVAAGREHGFIADTAGALEEWLAALDQCVAPNARLKRQHEEEPATVLSPTKANLGERSRWKAAHVKLTALDRVDSVRTSLQSSMHPELLKYANETDAMNDKKRQIARRHRIFEVCPDLNIKTINEDDNSLPLEHEELPKEFMGNLQFLVDCNEIRFRVADWVMSSIDSTKRGHVEPFFCTLSLFDCGRGVKVSEDFHFDINNDYLRLLIASAQSHGSPTIRSGRLRRMTRRQKRGLAGEMKTSSKPAASDTLVRAAKSLPDITENGNDQEEDDLTAAAETMEELGPTSAKQALFSVTFPSNEMYLVLRVEKVLQSGSISSVVEPYLKAVDPKITERIKSQAKVVCSRLGQYRMPFAWAARPLLKNGQMDYEGEFTQFFRQDRERLTNEEMIRLLQDLRATKLRPTVVPTDVMDITVRSVPKVISGSMTPSLIPVKPFSGTLRSMAMGASITREVQEIVPLHIYDPHPHNYISQSYRNLLYVYPISVKFDPQKTGTRARNITCYIHVKDSDEAGTKPLQCIYSRRLGGPIVHRTGTTVLYHNTSPTFYDEIKVEIPPHVHRKLHLLFTFCHISCEQPKGAVKRSTPESIVGFAWLPLMVNNRLVSKEQHLSVSSILPPNYLAMPCSVSEQQQLMGGSANKALTSLASPAKWIDSGKPLFRVDLNFLSTALTQDSNVQAFFKFCESYYPQTASAQDEVELCRLIRLLTSHGDVSTFINFLPVLMDQLIHLAVNNKEGPGDVPGLSIKIISFIADAVMHADREDQLKQYIKYCFLTDRQAKKTVGVHCRLVFSLGSLLQREHSVMEPMLGNLWFIMEIISKSMAQYLHYNDQLKRPRKTRFPEEFLTTTTELILTLMANIVKLEQFPKQTQQAVLSVGNFLKDCFSVMDRGHVFKMITTALSVFKPGDSSCRYDLKFLLLRTLCSHEHYMPINMPKLAKDESIDMVVTVDFSKKHFLTSLVLKEVTLVMRNEPSAIRASALVLLRDLMAKHDLDTRYSKQVCRRRIAGLYWSYVLTVLENISRIDVLSIMEAVDQPMPMPGAKNSTSVSSLAAMASFLGSIEGGGMSTSPSSASMAGMQRRKSAGDLEKINPPPGGRESTAPAAAAAAAAQKSETLPGKKVMVVPRTSTNSQGTAAAAATGGGAGPDSLEVPEPEKKDRMRMRSLTFVPASAEEISPMTLPDSPAPSSSFRAATPMASMAKGAMDMLHGKLSDKETRSMLSCFLFVVRDVGDDVLLSWWQHCLERDRHSHLWKEGEARASPGSLVHLLAFFDVMRICLQAFQYSGKTAILLRSSCRTQQMKTQLEQTYKGGKAFRPASVSLSSALRTRISSTANAAITAPDVSDLRIKLEANMGAEATLVVLDLLELFIANYREYLEENTGDNALMKRVFSIIITLLEVNQSQAALGHIFASLRAFIHKFSPALFQGGQEYCAELCYQILMKCNSTVRPIRMEACVVFYLLMRCSFEFVEGSFLRVHLQSIVALSHLIADGHLTGGHDSLRRSINSIESFSSRDKSTSAQFPAEVKDLTARLRNVLHATSEMKKHENDPEVLVEQQYVLAKSYSNAAQLRHTWLQSMAKLHEQFGNFSEAAHCCIHIAGIMAEYLKFKGQHSSGAADFVAIIPNVAKAESAMKEDLIDPTINIYTEGDYIDMLEECLFWLEKAERYEVMVDLFKLLQPYYDQQRNYEALANSLKSLAGACSKVVEVTRTKRRLLGSYFRIAFYGEVFGDDNCIEYIYKEPKVTRLADISLRLEDLYTRKLGQEVTIIKDSAKVDVDSLDVDRGYIQVTYVVPFFSEKELEARVTEFERNNNIQRFVFETPFTKSSSKSRGDVAEQCIHKSILTTANSFPYVKKRITIVEEENFDLTPIEVAIEELSRKLTELTEAVQRSPPDKVNLQRVVQGVVSVTVNAGPMAYATAFLKEPQCSSNPKNHVQTLRTLFRDLLKQCDMALELNSMIILSDQILYHEDLMSKYDLLVKALDALLDPPLTGPGDTQLPVAGDDD